MTPEEITKRRADKEAIDNKRSELLFKLIDASKEEDKTISQKLLEELIALDPPYCEHGRSSVSTCHACDEIDKECFPENYMKCLKCNELVYKHNICLDCFEG
jgi:hypothetical protein